MRVSLEAIAAAALLFLVLAPALQYSALPDKIPTHFGASGEPDAWRAKSHIWTLPVIGIVEFVLLTALTGYAGRKEALQSPPEWAEQRAALTRALMAAVKAHSLVLFAFIIHRSIAIAQGRAEGLGFALYALLGLIVPVIAAFLFRRHQMS